jgi:hypothetical protein
MVPRLLVVMLLPRKRGQRIEQDNQRMLIRYAAYYLSLSGMPAATQRGKVTVTIPRKNLLSVRNLRQLMAQAAQGKRKLS